MSSDPHMMERSEILCSSGAARVELTSLGDSIPLCKAPGSDFPRPDSISQLNFDQLNE